jgi:hypothetical protein
MLQDGGTVEVLNPKETVKAMIFILLQLFILKGRILIVGIQIDRYPCAQSPKGAARDGNDTWVGEPLEAPCI